MYIYIYTHICHSGNSCTTLNRVCSCSVKKEHIKQNNNNVLTTNKSGSLVGVSYFERPMVSDS